MYTNTSTVKIPAIKTIIAIVPPAIVTSAKREEPEIFSKAWEWDQMCNHCVD